MIRRTFFLTCVAFVTYEVLAQGCPYPPSVPQGKKFQKGVASLEHDWDNGFKMNLQFSIPENIDGWQIVMAFSKPVQNLLIWRARSLTSDGNLFQLNNMSWNKKLYKGQNLTMAFRAEKNGRTPLLCFVYLQWNGDTCPPTTIQLPTPKPKGCPDPPLVLQGKKAKKGVASLEHDWNNGFKMNLQFSISENIDGWQIVMAFSKPVQNLLVWRARSLTSDGNLFQLNNMPWNKKLYKGQNLTMAFRAEKNGRTPLVCFVYLQWNGDVCPPNTIQPPTPNPLATTKPPSKTTHPQTNSPVTTQKPLSTEPSGTPTPPTPSTSQLPPTTQTQPPTTRPAPTTPPQTKPPVTTQPPPLTPSTTLPPPVPPTVSPSCSKYDYNEVLRKSILFYEAQRSGKLPPNNRIRWRGDSALEDKGNAAEDLTGGWYDAGDYVKFGFPMAFSTTLLTWGFIEYKNAYSAAGEHDKMLDSIKWPLDYFIKAHVGKNELYAQVGDGHADHAQWGRPEDMTIARPAYKIDENKPGSDLAAETAAAMAAGSIAFRETNSQYADALIKNAKELYEFADQYRGKYTDSVPEARTFYSSSHYEDELAWAAAWLYKATKDSNYLQKAEKHFADWAPLKNPAWGFSWDEKSAGVQMLLYDLTGKSTYRMSIQSSLDNWLPGRSVDYTPKGLAWRIQWGANRYSANTAFLALLAADKGLKNEAYTKFGTNQIHYMLGDTGRSYVVGFGQNPPQRPHHRSSSCPNKPAPCTWNDYNNPGPNPQVLYGALVGGPDRFDNYQDKRTDYIMNEVATDYNAGFQSAVAALKAKEQCGTK